MKILLLCEGRTGSYSVMEWIEQCLGLKIIGETTEFDYKNNDDFIIKRTLSNNDFDINDYIYFDKVIILYRKDTLQQSLSLIYALLNQKWHHSFGTEDGFYKLDEDFLIEHHDDIWEKKYRYDEINQTYINLNFGQKITYEEIFIKKTGEQILKDYLNIDCHFDLVDETKKL